MSRRVALVVPDRGATTRRRLIRRPQDADFDVFGRIQSIEVPSRTLMVRKRYTLMPPAGLPDGDVDSARRMQPMMRGSGHPS